MRWEALIEFVQTNWGNLASLAGLFVSVATLIVARSARKAAREAKAEARRQGLVDELQAAQGKTEQVGQFLMQQKWEMVLVRAQDVVSACSQILRRWGAEQLEQPSRDEILRSREQLASIARIAVRAQAAAPTPQEVKRMASAQQRAFQLLSTQLAHSQVTIQQGGEQ